MHSFKRDADRSTQHEVEQTCNLPAILNSTSWLASAGSVANEITLINIWIVCLIVYYMLVLYDWTLHLPQLHMSKSATRVLHLL